MVGVIGDRQVLSQLGVIWREFGALCAARCLGAVLGRKRVTFLDVAFETETRKKLAQRKGEAER